MKGGSRQRDLSAVPGPAPVLSWPGGQPLPRAASEACGARPCSSQMRTVGGSRSWEISVLAGPGLWRPSREKIVAGLRPRRLETPPGWGERAVPGPTRLQPRPRSGRTWEAAPGADMAGSLGLPVPRRLCCHGGPLGTLHPGGGPAHCLPSQNVCPAWEFISSANNFFFFFPTEETAVQRG